jgi:NAD(P)-dependent dehydrogenase (short-subunit alcohol dehydrogenase family)
MLNLQNKLIVVTGATSGIGLATVEALVRHGAAVIGVGRSAQRCRAAEQRLREVAPGASITFCVADLSLQSEVRRLAAEIRAAVAGLGRNHLDGLVNNAGAFTYWLSLTAEGFETQWAVNYLAPFLLTHELLPLLGAASSGARVVTVSSESHAHTTLNWQDLQLLRRYNGLLAYQQTKLAGILFTAELNRRLGPAGRVRAFAADPGLVQTDIGFKGTPTLVRWVWRQRKNAGIPAAEAARGIVYLLGEDSLQDRPEVYWRHARPRRPDRRGLDAPAASRLWSVSERMCALPA